MNATPGAVYTFSNEVMGTLVLRCLCTESGQFRIVSHIVGTAGKDLSGYSVTIADDLRLGLKALTASQVISASLVALVASGKTVKEAFAIVLPEVNFDEMIGEIYSALGGAS